LFVHFWKQFDPIDTRLFAPAVPFLLLTLLALGTRHRWPVALGLLSCWLVAQGAHGVVTLERTARAWRQTGSPGLPSLPDARYDQATPPRRVQTVRTVHAMLAGRHAAAVIVSDGATRVYRHVTGARVKRLPTAIDRATLETINRVGRGGTLLLTHPSSVASVARAAGHDPTAAALPELKAMGLVAIPLPLALGPEAAAP
jgi:hypothetical protein